MTTETTETDSIETEQTTGAKACARCEGVSRRRFMQTAAVAGAVATTATGSAIAQETTTDDGPEWTEGYAGLNWGSDYTQNPYYQSDLTKAKHRVKWGTDDDALIRFENDSGNAEDLGAEVDREDTENVVSVRADKIDFPGARKFPRGATYDESGDGDDETEVSAIDATHWSTTDSASGTISVEDPGNDVPSLRISTSGVAAGETASATFDLTQFNAAITSDELKRYLQLVANVNSLASSATVTVAVVDGDGDRKEVVVDSSASGADADVLATSTVNGAVLQQRLQDLATNANGDGTFSNMEQLVVEIAEADADLTFTAVDIERKDELTFGSYLSNEDTDDEERVDRVEPSGEFDVTGLETFSDAFKTDDTVFYDVEFSAEVPLSASTLTHEYRFVEATERPGYEWTLEQRGKIQLRTAIDLSWSSPTLQDDVGVPSSRFLEVSTADGIDDVDFEDLDDSDWTEHTGDYSSEGKTVSLEDPAQTGEVEGYRARVLLTGSNRDTVESEGSSGGGAAGRGRDGGGGGIMGWIVGGATALVAFVAGSLRGLW